MLEEALPGGRKRRISRRSRTSAPSSEFVVSQSTVSACMVHAVDGDDGAKCARTRERTSVDLPT